ncbi:MAG TPA: hypothetical protein ENJ08_02710 [Gammaproteobacteria bacterium]|nr:hypothetical protein [Gammaproteobacteria bacterium]
MKTPELTDILTFLLLLLTTTTLDASATDNKPATAPDFRLYYLKANISNAIATIYLNDAPLISSTDLNNLRTQEPVNLWLLPGSNTLSFKIHPSINKNSANSPEDQAGDQAELQLEVFSHTTSGSNPGSKKIIASLNYRHSGTPAQLSTGLIQEKSVNFDFNFAIPVRLWHQASIISSIDNNDRKAITRLIESLSNSITNRNTTAAINLQAYKIAEDALAENKTEERLRTITANTYKWLFTQKNLKLKNTRDSSSQTEKFRFSLCCNNRLIHVTRYITDHDIGPVNENAIVFESDDLFFDINIFMAKIEGKWVIAR